MVLRYQVDIEVNDEPVDIHMKLDEFGAAFFVEDLSEGEELDGSFPPELATSPIPGRDTEALHEMDKRSSINRCVVMLLQIFTLKKLARFVCRSLLDDFNALETDKGKGHQEKQLQQMSGGHKGKLNRKKRKRRQQNTRHSRNSSRASLNEMMAEPERDSSESSSAEVAAASARKTSSVADELDNAEDGDDETDAPRGMMGPRSALSASTPVIRADGKRVMDQNQVGKNQGRYLFKYKPWLVCIFCPFL